MGYLIEIKIEAHQDSVAAYLYYEEQQQGLGERFLEVLNEAYQSIEQHPTHYSYIAEDPSNVFRDLRLKKFPYLVVYEIIGNTVIVYAVFHVRKHPASKLKVNK